MKQKLQQLAKRIEELHARACPGDLFVIRMISHVDGSVVKQYGTIGPRSIVVTFDEALDDDQLDE